MNPVSAPTLAKSTSTRARTDEDFILSTSSRSRVGSLEFARSIVYQGMLGRQENGATAENRVHPRGEDAHRLPEIVDGEIHKRADGFADPVLLHGQHALRPAHQLFHVVEQLLGIGRGLQEPLLQFALDDGRLLMPPATTIHHLLVGQHGFTLRAPVHPALLAIGEAALIHLQKEPLVPAIVFRHAGGDLAPPIVAHAQALELPRACDRCN